MFDISKLNNCPICNNKLNCYTSESHFVTLSYLGIYFKSLKSTIYFDHIIHNIYEIRAKNNLAVLAKVELESVEHAYTLANKIVENMIFL